MKLVEDEKNGNMNDLILEESDEMSNICSEIFKIKNDFVKDEVD